MMSVRIRAWRRRVLAIAAALTAIAAAGGCAPQVEVASIQDPAYRANLRRVFVVVDGRHLDDATMNVLSTNGTEFASGEVDSTSFTRVFVPALAEAFAEVGVEVRGHVVTGLELSNADIHARRQAFQPDALLNVKETWFGTLKDTGFFGLGENKKVVAIHLDASIPDETTPEDLFWRASLKVEDPGGDWKAMARSLAAALTAKLKADGLIDPEAPRTAKPQERGV